MTCACQHIAAVKWDFEQLCLDPPSLKYKKWSDFTGAIEDNAEIVGSLDESFVNAKRKAMEYCFGSSDPQVLKNRPKYLSVHEKISTGKHVIITGEKQTGKTLLAALIIKEVVLAVMIHRVDISFKWVKGAEILHAAYWDKNKPINHEYLDNLIDVDFLVIDGVRLIKGHISGPDTLVLDRMFGHRIIHGLPTIVLCSSEFKTQVFNPRLQGRDNITNTWGERFVRLMTNPSNTIIDLKRTKNG